MAGHITMPLPLTVRLRPAASPNPIKDAQVRILSVSQRQIGREQNEEGLFGFQTNVGIWPQHRCESAAEREQQRHPRRCDFTQPEEDESHHSRGQQDRLERHEVVLGKEEFPKLEEWNIEQNGDRAVTRPQHWGNRPAFEPGVEDGHDLIARVDFFADVAASA
jgi:hypothetical protein